jgi:serine/threonine protein kinase
MNPRDPHLVPPPAVEDTNAAAQETPAAGGGSTDHVFLGVGARPLPEYQLTAKLGQGGFGEVWKANGPGGFEVALKFIRLGEGAGGMEMKALQAVKGIRHPNLLSVFGLWEKDNYLIVAMELADRSLMDRLKEATKQGLPGIPATELMEYMQDAARGLDLLNERNIQHRDVKPHNLFIYGRGVKVADFGLAKVLEKSLATASAKMTPAYAAPEFLNGQASRWSDQYSLAASYCQLRANRLPFSGTMMEILSGHMTRHPDLAMLPEAERPAVLRAMAKEPNQRWPNCRAFIDALTAAQSGAPVPPPMHGGSGGIKKLAVVQPVSPSKATTELEELDDLPEATPPRTIPVVTIAQEGPGSSPPYQGGAGGVRPVRPHSASAVRSGNKLPRPPIPPRSPQRSSLGVGVILVGVLLLAGLGTVIAMWWAAGRVNDVAQKSTTETRSKETSTNTQPAPTEHANGKTQTTESVPPRPPAPGEPVLQLTPMEALTLKAGESRPLTVRIRRVRCQGPVRVRLQGLPKGVTAEETTLPANADAVDVMVRADADATITSVYVDVVATLEKTEGNLSFQLVVEADVPPPPVKPGHSWAVERLLPDGTDVVLHLDCRAFLEAPLTRQHLQEPLQQMMKEETVAVVLRNLDFDPLKDLHSLTLCFTDMREKKGGDVPWDADFFVVFKGKFRPEKIKESFRGQSIPHGAFTVLELKSEGNPPVYMVVLDESTVLMGSTQALATQVCDRVGQEGTPRYKPALARALEQVRRSQTFWMAMALPSFMRDQIRASGQPYELFANVTELTVHLSVADGIRMEAEAYSDDATAPKLKGILDPIKTFFAPMIEDKELADEVGRMIKETSITTSGRTLHIRTDCSPRLAEKLIELAKKSAK